MDGQKGMNPSVKTVAMLVLAVMLVVFLYAGYKGWITDSVNAFLNSVSYPKP